MWAAAFQRQPVSDAEDTLAGEAGSGYRPSVQSSRRLVRTAHRPRLKGRVGGTTRSILVIVARASRRTSVARALFSRPPHKDLDTQTDAGSEFDFTKGREESYTAFRNGGPKGHNGLA